uniref:ATP synthase complex subunit 8 n=1 Tax=Mycopsylla proxima TaxID=1681221 RepID=A0A343UQT8_9HEMI|nr:ATP synthase F0 subunit 8 [Mycopsylla proxima]AVF97063.1 ATP synthase F0 subunit 8 [Mycopsylla proxima]
MPQMSPIPWIMIFILTLFSIYLIMINIFFNSKINKNSNLKIYSIKNNLKW